LGVEAGGGSHATAASKIVDGDKGLRTLSLQTEHVRVDQLRNQKAGSIWKAVRGILDRRFWRCKDSAKHWRQVRRKYLGMSDYVYNFDSTFGQHAFIELCIPNYANCLAINLAGASIRWAPVCGNGPVGLCVILPGGLVLVLCGAGSVVIVGGLAPHSGLLR